MEVNHAQSNKYFLLLYCVGTLEPSSGGEGVSKEMGRGWASRQLSKMVPMRDLGEFQKE